MNSFDKVIDRRNTNSLKHDFAVENGLPSDVLPLWVADMDFQVPGCVTEALKKSVEHGIFGYSEVKSDYFNAVAAWFKKHFSWEVREEWLVKTPGVVYALAMAVRALTEKGDNIIIQPPVYYPFYNVIRNNERNIIENPLIFENGKYKIDFEDFENKIITNNVKLFILCSPHNPVCRVWSRQELKRLGEICQRHGVYVVADEIHCDFTREGHEHTVFPLAAPEMENRVIICTAPSKTFNLAGLQVSNIFIPDADIREKYQRELAASGFSVSNILGLVACKAAYEGGEQWSKECKEYIEGNLNYLRSFLEKNIPEIELVEPEGTYFAWLNCSGLGLTKDELNRLIIEKAKLWLDAGDIFGEASAQFQRVVLACPRETIEKALNQLKAAVDSIK